MTHPTKSNGSALARHTITRRMVCTGYVMAGALAGLAAWRPSGVEALRIVLVCVVPVCAVWLLIDWQRLRKLRADN